MNQKAKPGTKLYLGFIQIILIIVILVTLVAIGFLLFGIKPSKNPTPKATKAPVPTPTALGTPNPTTDQSLIVGWKTYSDSHFGFELKYPKGFSFLENGPSNSDTPATTSAQVSGDEFKIWSKVTFTDSNHHTFTLNVYPVSPDSNFDTNLTNFNKYASICQLPAGAVSAKVGVISYNQVYKTGPKGESLVYFCQFTPKGNLLVLRNNSGSTEIAMRLMLSTLRFTP